MKTIKINLAFIFIVILLVNNVVNAEQIPSLKVNARNVTVNGVSLLDGEKEIIKALGEPIKTTVGFSEVFTNKTKNIYFKGLKIYLSEDSILKLTCELNCITNKGIKIGSTMKQVFDAYGTNKEQKYQANYVFLVPEGNLEASLIFLFKSGVVSSIEYWVNYV